MDSIDIKIMDTYVTLWKFYESSSCSTVSGTFIFQSQTDMGEQSLGMNPDPHLFRQRVAGVTRTGIVAMIA